MKSFLLVVLFILLCVVQSQGQDTLNFHKAYLTLQHEAMKKGYLQLDSLVWYGNAAIAEGRKSKYPEGIIRTWMDLGAGFLIKGEVDSSKLYYDKSIAYSTALKNNRLLAMAYSGMAWTLVYDNSDYGGSIENLQKAVTLAENDGDTSLYIYMATRLIKVYFQASKLTEAYRLCTDLQNLCVARKDTSAQITNYYMFVSIYARMNLFEKQMEMVHKVQALSRNKVDTLYLYTVNLTASNAYLIRQQYDSVLYYSRLNLPYCQHLKLMPNGYSNIARAFLETNQLDSARYYYNLIMDYHSSHHTYIDTYLYLDLGTLEWKSGRKVKALEYYKKAEADISKPSLSTQIDIYKTLYEFYNASGATAPTLYYLRKYKTWSDSLSNQQFGVTVLDYQSSLLKEENDKLLKEKQIQSLLADKLKMEANFLFGAISLLVLLSGASIHWLWKKRILRQKQMLIKDRLRISRELHDEVGATLSGIAMYSHVASTQLHNAETASVAQSLSFMQKSAGEMVSKLSDIVWLINPEQDTIMEMLGRLGEYGKQMTRARAMNIKLDVPQDLADKHIPLEARRNIYLFCKEAINNAVKYSNGKTIVLQAKSVGQQLIFSVTDDGNGFDVSIIRQGNGLVNMQKRAEDIGAVFQMDSKINHGTRLELQYKIIQ